MVRRSRFLGGFRKREAVVLDDGFALRTELVRTENRTSEEGDVLHALFRGLLSPRAGAFPPPGQTEIHVHGHFLPVPGFPSGTLVRLALGWALGYKPRSRH